MLRSGFYSGVIPGSYYESMNNAKSQKQSSQNLDLNPEAAEEQSFLKVMAGWI